MHTTEARYHTGLSERNHNSADFLKLSPLDVSETLPDSESTLFFFRNVYPCSLFTLWGVID